MTETFSPAKPPGFGSRMSSVDRVRRVDFGDGYVQAAQYGLNAEPVQLDLVWPALTVAEGLAIRAFMVARGTWQSFYYTFPGDTQRKYRRKGPIVLTYENSGVVVSVSVSLEESFDP